MDQDDEIMKALEQLIAEAAKGGETRSGIILGIRMALRALKELGIEDVGCDRRRLIVFVELDRCLPDAVQLVTGCRLGNRTLKFRDFGKMAATFVDLLTNRAVRVAALESPHQQAAQMLSDSEREHALQQAYQTLPDDALFRSEWVQMKLSPVELPGAPRARVVCAQCGEGIGLGRQIIRAGQTLCRSCAGEAYYSRPVGYRTQ